jgi:hypothetical protein
MVRMMVRHPVRDYAAWRKEYDDFDATRQGMGVTAAAVFQSVDDPNDVTVTHDFATAEAARAFADSAELESAMENAGVAGPPTIWFVNGA